MGALVISAVAAAFWLRSILKVHRDLDEVGRLQEAERERLEKLDAAVEEYREARERADKLTERYILALLDIAEAVGTSKLPFSADFPTELRGYAAQILEAMDARWPRA